MKNKNMTYSALFEKSLLYVKSNRGKMPELAENTGISYGWLHKFSNDEIKNPSVRKIEILLLTQQEKERTEGDDDLMRQKKQVTAQMNTLADKILQQAQDNS